MTELRSSICGSVKISNGRVFSIEKDIKKRWKIYRKRSYRRDPNINYTFNENLYEDEPDVLEIEEKELIHHISYRKAPGCDGIPI